LIAAVEWAMIVVAYKHGMRASEVCNLRLDDIDMKNGSIVVERLKGSLRTTQAVTEHRGEPLLNELKDLRECLFDNQTVVALELRQPNVIWIDPVIVLEGPAHRPHLVKR
jgi:integrase